jgi:tetratricopeptide (TPR) repeat protein
MRGLSIIVGLFALATSGCGTGRKAQWDAPATPAAGSSAGGGAAESGGVVEDAAAAGEAAWQQRGTRAGLEQTIARWEAVVAAQPGDGATWARLSRAYYLLADGYHRNEPKSDAYLGTFEKGTAAGERALAALNPEFKARVTKGDKVEEAIKVVGKEGLDAMYWYAVNLGKWSRAKGLAALLGNKDRVKGVITRVLELEETYFHGAPHRYFGAYWSLLPVGRDLDKSRQHFETSLQIAPDYAGTKVLMAETYAVKQQDRALFQKLLDEVLSMPDDALPDLVPETGIEKEKARELKAKVDDLF